MPLHNLQLSLDAVRIIPQVAGIAPLCAHIGAIACSAYQLDGESLVTALLAREAQETTAIGHGFAIPHARITDANANALVVIRLREPLAMGARDAQPVDLIFALISDSSSGTRHLQNLAELSRLLRDQHFAQQLRGAQNSDALFALLRGGQEQAAA
jgi:PTS system nitrogen regulatory IIA component